VNLYREVELEKEPCDFVGVPCLMWHWHPDKPTIGFVEVELEDIPEVKTLKERVAELGADAKLGRMVREMPEGTSLHHNSNGYDEWSYDYKPGTSRCTWEPTPEAALEAARKEETQCDRCGLKLAHEPTPGINYGPVVTTYYPPVVTNAPDQPAQVTFYPQEVIHTPGELSQYPSKTVGEP